MDRQLSNNDNKVWNFLFVQYSAALGPRIHSHREQEIRTSHNSNYRYKTIKFSSDLDRANDSKQDSSYKEILKVHLVHDQKKLKKNKKRHHLLRRFPISYWPQNIKSRTSSTWTFNPINVKSVISTNTTARSACVILAICLKANVAKTIFAYYVHSKFKTKKPKIIHTEPHVPINAVHQEVVPLTVISLSYRMLPMMLKLSDTQTLNAWAFFQIICSRLLNRKV